MDHETEYGESMVAMLELIWGKGYMAPGGPGNVANLLAGTSPAGKRILDIGCGIGGPALEMAKVHGLQVVGIDLEAPLIDRARKYALEAGLEDQCQFECVEPGPLHFPDESFDIVTSSGAITQTPDKEQIFSECWRILRPGGYLRCYEWMRSERDYSEDMLYWFKVEGLTYALETLEQYGQRLIDVGFTEMTSEDASDWYKREVRSEYELIRGDLYPAMVESLGKEDADHFVEDWRAMVIVCESGEMRQGYFGGQKEI